MSTTPDYRVRVGLPHFFQNSDNTKGYGSSRRDNHFPRTLALARCLQGLLALQRRSDDVLLNMAGCLQPGGPLHWGELLLPPLQLEIHVFTDGEHVLAEVLERFASQITVHRLALEDPRQLPLACRDHLIAAEPLVDLTLYCEDDLVIGDPLFFDKQLWFVNNCQGRAVLMPHRYELIPGAGGRRLLPDGPLKPAFIRRFYQPRDAVISGRFYDGQQVTFDRTANPHSGMFCLNAEQVTRLRQQTLPTEGFESQLETAATLTVLQHFAVLKPSLPQRSFLWVEHAHPSYLMYLNTCPPCPA